MNYKRRDFIKTTTTGIALTAITGNLAALGTDSLFGGENLKEFGLQLYTLRDIMPKDPRGVLKKVAAMGYKQIESFEHAEMGMFWGMKNTEFKKLMDDLGMTLISSHCNIEKDFERKVDEAAEIGMKYLIDPNIGTQKSIDVFKNYAEKFNKLGEMCKKAGFRFAYHNHDYPFKAVDGQLPLDVLIQNTDPSLVDFELDIYWVVTAGADPVKWFKKYPHRFRLCHLKDRKRTAMPSEREVSVNLGTGSIDFKRILKVGKENGLKYYFVEQEKYEHSTPLEAAMIDAKYLKKLHF